MADVFGGPWRRVGAYVRRRRALLAAVVFLFGIGLAAGWVASGRTEATLRDALRSRLDAVWASARDSRRAAAEAPGSRPGPGAVLRISWFGPGGGLYVIGGCALLGLSIVGGPLTLAVALVRGFVLGFAAGALVDAYAWRGAALAVAGLLPQHAFTGAGVTLAVAAAVDFSWRALGSLVGGRRGSVRSLAWRALLLWCGGGVLWSAGALMESYVTPGLVAWTAVRLLGE